jgi:uncharacterized protein YndB with AHSA1/START domain
MANNTSASKDRIVITRIFDAPREMVWKAWTDPNHLVAWWGPRYFTSPAAKIDFRVGGKYLFCMRSPEGQDYYSAGTYNEIVPPQRIVYTDSFADAEGNILSPAEFGMGDIPTIQIMTLTLEDIGGKTRLTLSQADIPDGEAKKNMITGWNESFDKLAESLIPPHR